MLKKPETHRSRHSRTTIIGRASAKTDDNFPGVVACGVQQHFADAKSVCAKRIAFSFRNSPHYRRFTHFHHSKPPFLDPRITHADLAAEWIMRVAYLPRAAERVANCLGRPLSAIGHRHDVDHCVATDI